MKASFCQENEKHYTNVCGMSNDENNKLTVYITALQDSLILLFDDQCND